MNTNRLTEAQNRYARAVLAQVEANAKAEALRLRQVSLEYEVVQAAEHAENLEEARQQADVELACANHELRAAIIETSTPKPDREQFWQAAAKPVECPRHHDGKVYTTKLCKYPCGFDDDTYLSVGSCEHLRCNSDGTRVECADCNAVLPPKVSAPYGGADHEPDCAIYSTRLPQMCTCGLDERIGSSV